MGGLVARALLTLKNFKQDLLNLLITQATPHVAPVMPLDRFITGECGSVNTDWPPMVVYMNTNPCSCSR